MKKLFLFFTLFLVVNLNANSYHIKLGTYKYLKSVKSDQKRLKYSSYILDNKKYHGLYTGDFKDKKSAKLFLKKVQKEFKDAYIVTSITSRQQHQIKSASQSFNSVKKDDLQIAKTYYKIGAFEKALAKFDQILISEPNNSLARLEYAKTLYMLGFYKDASKEFRTVLQINPPKTVQNNINNYLKKINSLSKKEYFYGSLGIGLTYDDNLGFNTHLPTTTYGGLVLQNDTNMIKGIYTNLNLALMYLYVGEHFDWSNTLYSYNEFQNEKIDNLNFLNFITALSKKYENFKVSLPFGVSSSWLDGKAYNLSYSLNPTLNFQTDKSTYFAILMKYQQTKISKNSDKNYKTFGTKISMTKLFDKLSLYTSGTAQKDVRDYKKRYDISRDRVFFSLRADYKILKRCVVNFGYQYSFDRYKHIDPALGYKREDSKKSYSASIKQKLSKQTIATIGYQKLINDSNINSYSYKKNSYNLTYQHNF